MNLLFDTNILVNIVKSRNRAGLSKFLNPNSELVYISVVTEAEIRSFAIRNNWGLNRLTTLEEFLDDVNIVEVDQSHVNTYAQIDSFSQRTNPYFTQYNFETPRNMGKNDLWIATLAALLGLKLVTADSDFDHLDKIFFEVRKIVPAELSGFL